MALPANVGFCEVTGRFIQAVIDGSDVNRDPEGVPITGLTITFKASVPRVINAGATPPTTIELLPVTVHTDTDGVLVDATSVAGIYLVASDDADLNPHGWTYQATVSAPTLAAYSFSFVAPVDGVIDLSTVIQVPANPGTELQAWTLAVAETAANVAASQAILDEFNDVIPDQTGNAGKYLKTDGADLSWGTPAGGGGGGAVDSVNTQTGDVVLDYTDVGADAAGAAAAAQTVAAADATSKVATETTRAETAEALLAPKASPVFTGDPKAPTPTAGDNDTSIATTAFVKAAIDLLINGAPGALDTLKEIADQLATDESAVSALVTTVAGKVPATRQVNGHALSADVTIAQSDIAGLVAALAALAPLASPALTGNPTVPTQTAGDSSTKVASTAFVTGAIATLMPVYVLAPSDPDPVSGTSPAGFYFHRTT